MATVKCMKCIQLSKKSYKIIGSKNKDRSALGNDSLVRATSWQKKKRAKNAIVGVPHCYSSNFDAHEKGRKIEFCT